MRMHMRMRIHACIITNLKRTHIKGLMAIFLPQKLTSQVRQDLAGKPDAIKEKIVSGRLRPKLLLQTP